VQFFDKLVYCFVFIVHARKKAPYGMPQLWSMILIDFCDLRR
jgi:hypothetical protein